MKRLRSETVTLHLNDFNYPAEKLARSLLGTVLVHGPTAGMIVETEAYLGTEDLAAHASRGITDRTRVLFGPPGRAYVYFIYGMHECLNVVADREGVAGCVLIRALQPLSGIGKMQARRAWRGPIEGLANGPGKLTQALAITRAQYGARLDIGVFTIRAWRHKPVFDIAVSPRIGIRHCADWPLRFSWANHPCLSRQVKCPK